ncbi:MAG: hypothetical protein ACE5GC_00800, partial [Acidimicrobiia bacterium]
MTLWKRLLLFGVAFALVAAACGDDDEGLGTGECSTTARVRVQLQWVAQSQFAGYFVADDLGFYGDE